MEKEKLNIRNPTSVWNSTLSEKQDKVVSQDSERKSQVLLVEDNRISAKIAKGILSNFNCQVDVVMDGKMALEHAEKNQYDLIFVDMGLPDMMGDAVTRRIRAIELKKGKHVPIIGLTAYIDTENQQQCLDSGMNAIVIKPLRIKQAEMLLNEFIPNRKKWKKEVESSASESGNKEQEIVDFEFAKGLIGGDEKVVNEMLAMLVDSLPHEVEKLETAYTEENWAAVQSVAHKLSGGASYCGTRRLKVACDNLDSYIYTGSTVLIPELYEKMLAEIEMFLRFMEERK